MTYILSDNLVTLEDDDQDDLMAVHDDVTDAMRWNWGRLLTPAERTPRIGRCEYLGPVEAGGRRKRCTHAAIDGYCLDHEPGGVL